MSEAWVSGFSAAELERRLLEAYITTPEAIDTHPVPPSLFRDRRALRTFEALRHLRAKAARPDPLSLEVVLKDLGHWGAGVDHEWLLDLTGCPVLASSIPLVVDRLRKLKQLADAREAAQRALAAADQGDLDECKRLLRQGAEMSDEGAEERVKSIQQVCEGTARSLMNDAPPYYATFGGERFPTLREGVQFTGDTCTIIGAASSTGKTSVALEGAIDLAKFQGIPTGFLSCEDPESDFGAKTLGRFARVNPAAMWERRMSKMDVRSFIDAGAEIQGMPLYFSAPKGQHIDEIEADIAVMASRYGCRVILIDYIQIITGGQGKDPRTRIDDVLSRLIIAFRRHRVDGVILSQLKEVDSNPFKEPHLSQLKESRTLTERAQQVVLMWRDGGGRDAQHWLKVAKRKRGPVGYPSRFVRGDDGSVYEPAPSVEHAPLESYADDLDNW